MVTKEEKSFIFTDSCIQIVLVDKDFKPLDVESKIFCDVYKNSYNECKKLFTLYSGKEVIWYGLGDSRHAIFILYPIVNYRKVNEMCSMISRICAKNHSVALLNAKKDFRIESYLDSVLDLDIRSYEKALI